MIQLEDLGKPFDDRTAVDWLVLTSIQDSHSLSQVRMEQGCGNHPAPDLDTPKVGQRGN